jgi:hypothetical protein
MATLTEDTDEAIVVRLSIGSPAALELEET